LAGLSSSMKWHAVSGILAICQRKSIERMQLLFDETSSFLMGIFIEFHELF